MIPLFIHLATVTFFDMSLDCLSETFPTHRKTDCFLKKDVPRMLKVVVIPDDTILMVST